MHHRLRNHGHEPIDARPNDRDIKFFDDSSGAALADAIPEMPIGNRPRQLNRSQRDPLAPMCPNTGRSACLRPIRKAVLPSGESPATGTGCLRALVNDWHAMMTLIWQAMALEGTCLTAQGRPSQLPRNAIPLEIRSRAFGRRQACTTDDGRRCCACGCRTIDGFAGLEPARPCPHRSSRPGNARDRCAQLSGQSAGARTCQ